MANDKDFILNNAVEIGGSTKVTIGDAPAGGSVTVGSWDVSTSVYLQNFSVSTQESYPIGIFFKPDGLKMYVVGGAGADVIEYNLSTAWDVSTSVYLQNFSVNSQDTAPTGIFFKPDGLKMYVLGNYSNELNEWDLSTAWDISTATYVQTFSVNSQDTAPYGVFFKPDGLKMYVSGTSGRDINEYNLSTAWNISTSVYLQNFSVSAQDDDPVEVFFKPDGLKMYVVGYSAGVIEYDLSTAWDISTASFLQSFSVATQATYPQGLFIKPDGTKMYVVGPTTQSVNEYDLSSTLATATFDTSTGNYFTHTPSVSSEYGFSNAGDVQTFQLEVTGNQVGYSIANTVYDSVSFDTDQQETAPITITFKPDGLKMYLVGITGDDVNEYNLSTAWDVSTSVYSQAYPFGSQETVVRGIAFKTDGTRMYLNGNNGYVYQYDLSTAWDVTTSNYNSVSYNLDPESRYPRGLSFKSDGTKFYMISQVGGRIVHQYDLSTAWDLSSTSYNSVSFDTQLADIMGFAMADDGSMFATSRGGGGSSNVFEGYTLSTPWDITTANLVGTAASSPSALLEGICFGNNGSKLYLADKTDFIFQYSISAPITITWDADIEWGGGTAPDSPASGEKDLYTITTDDGGTTYFGVQSGDNFS